MSRLVRAGAADPAVQHRRTLVRTLVLAAAAGTVPLVRKALARSNTQVHRHEPRR